MQPRFKDSVCWVVTHLCGIGDSIITMALHHQVSFYCVVDEETITLLKVSLDGGFGPGSKPGLHSHSGLHTTLVILQKSWNSVKCIIPENVNSQETKTEKKETFLGEC